MAGYYDYNELRQRAIDGDANDVDALGEWMENYGRRYWNGEYYDLGDGLRLYPFADFSGYMLV